MTDAAKRKLLSIVVPVHNEAGAIRSFLDGVRSELARLPVDHEILFVIDGDSDGTTEVIRGEAAADSRVKFVKLSRNFGKEAALTAGIDTCRGDAVVPIDVDLQDPPSLIPVFVEKWEQGYDIVYGARINRAGDPFLKRWSSKLFHILFAKLTRGMTQGDIGDFRLMSRRVVGEVARLRERNRYMKGLFAWVGFRSIAVPYDRTDGADRESRFTFWRLWNFALDGITGFSTFPLRIWTYIGTSIAGLAFFYSCFILVRTLILGIAVPGYASLMVIVLFLGGIQLVSLGVIGEYLGRIYIETKGRPLYVIDETGGFASEMVTSDVANSL